MLVGLFLVIAAVLVAVGGLLAATDAAINSLSRAEIGELADTSRAKRSLRAIADDPGAHANAVNFSRIVAETTAAVLVTLAFTTIFPEAWLVLIVAVLAMTVASFVLVGSSPRSVGRAHPRGLLKAAALFAHFLRFVLGPIANALVAIGNRVTPGRPRAATFSSEEQLLSMVDEAAELEVLDQDDRELIHSIFEWGDTVVREVMVPRTDMITVDDDATPAAAMAQFLRTGVSRMPVVGRDADEIFGVLYLRDVARLISERPGPERAADDRAAAETLAADATSTKKKKSKNASATVKRLARPANFVPESKKADATLRMMQLESNHLAMVVDEYGGIAGLVTMEDLIEELVGEISDEYDRDTPDVIELTAGVYRVDARLPTDELGDLFGIELDDEDVDSVGGLLTKQLGRLPVPGSTATASGLVLRAERVEGRRRVLRTVVVERDPGLVAVEDSLDEPSDREGRGDRERSADDVRRV